ncbi:N-acetyltransferase [Flavobacterium columnare]|uniref:GCN5-like N-acetyltransferase n=2 Tax=Flavobacterium columnare TaxID=996 RepID=G8X590_FLACA|nr:GNAT family N-acetyltransferase [Flavobacterium columnare]AEW85501.1 GCN5-like N-acetyltransferase [Flavobacterium columnare ATCC 49512]ANO49299.1 GCN5-like N-acetyltransferase [Flavobacterium columnare]APT22719.1 GNAT family N-acetyltransferase [Flavobacterium columnare]AUX18049.1 GCN5 family acetyltransferase [Flavobacterium columnare]OOB83085.1 GNAT family N-acetyltransferase [Flavobacterium columnare]
MIHFKLIEQDQIDLAVQMMQDFYAIDNYPINPKTSSALFHEFISNSNLGRCWFVYHENKIVGYIILTFIFSFEYQGTLAFIDELYLTESSRGKGIGKKALDFIKEQALIFNIKMIYLEVEEHNSNAQKLYTSNDFVIHKRKIMKYKTR